MSEEKDKSRQYCLTTKQYAEKHLVEAETVIRRRSQTGSYFGDVPEKLPNGRLKWPD